MRQSQPRRKTRRKSSKGISESKINKPRPLTISLKPQKRKKRGVTLVRSHVSTAIKKVTIPAITLSQKTNISLDNLRAGN